MMLGYLPKITSQTNSRNMSKIIPLKNCTKIQVTFKQYPAIQVVASGQQSYRNCSKMIQRLESKVNCKHPKAWIFAKSAALQAEKSNREIPIPQLAVPKNRMHKVEKLNCCSILQLKSGQKVLKIQICKLLISN